MASLTGTTVAGPLVTPTDADKFPTHYASLGKGGWRTVDTTEERDAISVKRIEPGMAVYVRSENKLYICTKLDTSASQPIIEWEEFKNGSEIFITKFKVMITTGNLQITSKELFHEICPSFDEEGNPIFGDVTGVPPYLNTIEAFALILTTSVQDSDIEITFGDGTVIKVSDYTDGVIFENTSLVIHHRTEDNALLIAHKYSNDWIKAGTQSTVDNTVYFRSDIITITGKDYSNINNNYTGMHTGSGEFKSLLPSYHNRIIDLITNELPLSPHITDLSYLVFQDRLIRKISVNNNTISNNVTNLFHFASAASNLNYIYGFNALPSSTVETISHAFSSCSKLIKTDFVIPSSFTDQEKGMAYVFQNCSIMTVNIADLLPTNGFISNKINVYNAFLNCHKLQGKIPDNIFWGNISNTFVTDSGKLITNAVTQVFCANISTTTPAECCKDMMPIWCNTEYLTKIRVKFIRLGSESNDNRNQICLHLTKEYTNCDVVISMTNSKGTGYELAKSTPTSGGDFRCSDGVTCLFELRFFDKLPNFLSDTDYAEIIILGKDYDRVYAAGSCNNIYEALTPDLPVAPHLTNFSYLFADTANASSFNTKVCENLVIGDWFDNNKTYDFSRAFAKCNNLKTITGFKNIKNITGTNLFYKSDLLEYTDLFNTRHNPLYVFDKTTDISANTTIKLDQTINSYCFNLTTTSSSPAKLTFSFNNPITTGRTVLSNGLIKFKLCFRYGATEGYTGEKQVILNNSSFKITLNNASDSAMCELLYDGLSFYVIQPTKLTTDAESQDYRITKLENTISQLTGTEQ